MIFTARPFVWFEAYKLTPVRLFSTLLYASLRPKV